jgi:hypothetical protein
VFITKDFYDLKNCLQIDNNLFIDCFYLEDAPFITIDDCKVFFDEFFDPAKIDDISKSEDGTNKRFKFQMDQNREISNEESEEKFPCQKSDENEKNR